MYNPNLIMRKQTNPKCQMFYKLLVLIKGAKIMKDWKIPRLEEIKKMQPHGIWDHEWILEQEKDISRTG